MNKKTEKTDPKQKLLSAAINVFAQSGYDGATTRRIARAAQMNISAINYYFGGKRGLYRAALDVIRGKVAERLLEHSELPRALLNKRGVKRAAYRAALLDMLCFLCRVFAGDSLSPAMVQIIIREQQMPTGAMKSFYESTFSVVTDTFSRLMSRCTGIKYPSDELVFATQTLLGTVTVFRTHRDMVYWRLGVKAFSEKQLKLLEAIVRRNGEAILDSYLSGGKVK